MASKEPPSREPDDARASGAQGGSPDSQDRRAKEPKADRPHPLTGTTEPYRWGALVRWEAPGTPASYYGPQQELAAREAEEFADTARKSEQPGAAFLWLHVGHAFRHALQLAKFVRASPTLPERFVGEQVRLEALLDRFKEHEQTKEYLATWPTDPGVTFSWLAGNSYLDVAFRFARMVHVEIRATLVSALSTFRPPPDAQITPRCDARLVAWMDAALEGLAARTLPRAWDLWEMHRDGESLLHKLRAEYEEACSRARADEAAATSGPTSKPPAPNSLRRTTVGWKITFRGEVADLRPLKGFRYIAHVLENPNLEFSAQELRVAVAGVPASAVPVSTGRGGRGRRPAEAAELGRTGLGAGLPAADARTLKEVRQERRRACEERDAAEARGDPDEYDRLEAEVEKLSAYLRSSTDKRGRPRLERSVAEKARKAVTGVTDRAFAALEAAHQEAHAHLRKAVKFGATCRFTPDPTVEWTVYDASSD